MRQMELSILIRQMCYETNRVIYHHLVSTCTNETNGIIYFDDINGILFLGNSNGVIYLDETKGVIYLETNSVKEK